MMLMDAEQRKLIPPIVYRLNRGEKNGADVLTEFVNGLGTTISATSEEAAYASLLLYSLIVFSEMWDRPQPSMSEMEKRFASHGISYGIYGMLPVYCAFSKDKSATCDELGYGKYAANGIIYERDEYWNKSATIPSQASVLLLSSKLDARTPHKFAEYLLEALDGDKKELVTFNYSTHGALMWTQLNAEDPASTTCGVKIVASYVTSKGDLKGLDKSCVDEMPQFSDGVD